MATAGQPTIIHISADFPDAVSQSKTRAISALLELTGDKFFHRVYSINRFGTSADAWLRPGKIRQVADDGMIATWRYAAPPNSVFLARSMRALAREILHDIEARQLKPDLIHAHKLSFEGLVAHDVASALGVPFALTLQGNTDQKLVRIRKDLRQKYRTLWQEASMAIAFSPWIKDWLSGHLGHREKPVELIPCIPVADRIIAPRDNPGTTIATAFNLNDWRNKNIATLIAACARARSSQPQLRLEIAGDGSKASMEAVDRLIAENNATAFVHRIGRLSAEQIQVWMNSACLFALPSRRESFGMVFVEALLAGTPVIYPQGAAIDGWFPMAPFALGVSAGSIDSISHAIVEIVTHQQAVRGALKAWQAENAERFRESSIITRYREATNLALASCL